MILGSRLYLSTWLPESALASASSSPNEVPLPALFGFLQSWSDLVSQPLDLELAKDLGLIDDNTTWTEWNAQVRVQRVLSEQHGLESWRQRTEYPLTQRRLRWRYRLARNCRVPFGGTYKHYLKGVQGEWIFSCQFKPKDLINHYLPAFLETTGEHQDQSSKATVAPQAQVTLDVTSVDEQGLAYAASKPHVNVPSRGKLEAYPVTPPEYSAGHQGASQSHLAEAERLPKKETIPDDVT